MPELGLLETDKAWKEMILRYFAASLGLLILFIFLGSMLLKAYRSLLLITTSLLLLVLFQAILGMLTVTMSLQPLVVVGHLLGGFLVLNLTWLLLLKLNNPSLQKTTINFNNGFLISVFLIVLVLSQIALGGWLTANYAATYCYQLPLCDGFSITYSWQQFSFSSIWQLPSSDSSYEFGVLPAQARLSIHLLHRFWAIITTLSVLVFVCRLYQTSINQHIKNCVLWVIFLMLSQLFLGVMIVFFDFPLFIALAHNLCAALLLMSLIRLSYNLNKESDNNTEQQLGAENGTIIKTT